MADPVKRRCFMVGHIGAAGSPERLHGDWVLDEIVRPAIESADLVVERADNIAQPGMIDGQIIRSLLEADLVVADLSMLNPNVLYEVGIRHTVQKPIVHMFLAGQALPFDLRQFRSIEFSMETPADMRSARERLKQQAQLALETAKVDNPVTVAMGLAEFERTASPAEQVLAQQVGELAHRLETLELRSVGAAPGNTLLFDATTHGRGLAGILGQYWDGPPAPGDRPPAMRVRAKTSAEALPLTDLRRKLVALLDGAEVVFRRREGRLFDVHLPEEIDEASQAQIVRLIQECGFDILRL